MPGSFATPIRPKAESAEPCTDSGYACRVETTAKRHPRYVAALAAVASLILIGGWLSRPREIPASPEAIPSETDLEQLARHAERRSLESAARYFAGAAREVDASIVHLRDADTSGTVWDDARIITAALRRGRASRASIVKSASGEAAARAAIEGPHVPFTVLERPRELAGLMPARRAASAPLAGDWVIAVWRIAGDRTFAAGNFRQPASVTCGVTPVQEMISSLSLTAPMLGGGLFDIDGGLLGVILPCRDHIAAITAGSIDTMLAGAGTLAQQVLARDGFAAGPLSADEAGYFQTTNGLLVRQVWIGYAGDAAGLRPGDIITALNGQAVNTAEELRPLAIASDAPIELAVRRGSKTEKMSLPVEPDATAAGAAGAGLVWEPPPGAYRIGAVRPGSRAARAGLEPGDRLVRIDQVEPRSLSQVERILGGGSASRQWLEIDRDDRRIGILLR